MSSAFENFLRGHGFIIQEAILPNDEIYRFAHRDKPHSKSGWAKLFPDGNAGLWGDWRNSEGHKYWREDGRTYKQLTRPERQIVIEQQKIANERHQEKYTELAKVNQQAWANMADTGLPCPYLAKKKVGNYGLKIDANSHAWCPAMDVTGTLYNIQNISASPKLFRPGKMGGCFHVIEGNREKIILASGYATGASIHEATGLCVVVCFGDGNMLKVAKALREAKWGPLVLACDNDDGGSHSGNLIAQKAKELKFEVVLPRDRGDFNDLRNAGIDIYGYFFTTTPVFSFSALMADCSPMPEDLIEPRILTEGGMLVFGGAPKVGKSDFVLSWLAHMAGGLPFMGMTPPRPLKVFYLQAEIQYHYIRERVKMLNLYSSALQHVERNLYITPQVRMILDQQGVKTVGNTIRQCFGAAGPDIIAIDPISNLYDQESENDNAQMMTFLSQRVESLRDYASEKAGFVLVHHTKKIAKDELAKDPFQMFSGASSLRRYYTTGMLMYRPDEEVSECILTYEVRNGARVPTIHVDKNMGRWVVVPKEESRIGKHDAEKALDEERQRKIAIVRDEIQYQMSQGFDYTVNSFSEYMAGKSGLGSSRTINTLLREMLAQGDIWLENKEGEKRQYLMA